MNAMTLKIVNAEGAVLQSCTGPGTLRLVYREAYRPGDCLVLDAGAPGRFAVVQWEDTMPPALLYAAQRELRFRVPFGEQATVRGLPGAARPPRAARGGRRTAQPGLQPL